MKQILFASNFSDSCDNAYDYLIHLVSDKDVKVHIIHVFDIPVSSLSTLPYNAIQGMIIEKRSAAISHMTKMINKLQTINQGQIFPEFGVYPSTYIAELSKRLGVDLIIMGLREKYSLFERMIGSTTAHTIHQTNIPVLAIPNGARFLQINDIVFPTNIEEINQMAEGEVNALAYLQNFWALLKEPNIHLIHIRIDDDDNPVKLKRYTNGTMDMEIRYADSVADGIMDTLRNRKVELLAFYKPQRKFWERLYHHSMTRAILYQSRLPLLIFS